MGDWSELSDKLLSPLLSRLQLVDIIRCKLVCKSWCSVFEKMRLRAPLLILGDDNKEDQTQGFFSITDQTTYRLKLPELCGKYCCGSSKGWLVTLDMNYEMHLLQPFSRTLIRLPSPPRLFDDFNEDTEFSVQYLSRFKMKKVIISSDPIASPQKCVIMAIIGTRDKLAFCKLGDERWTQIDDGFERYWDIIFYKGQFFGATGDVVACDLRKVPHTRLFARGPYVIVKPRAIPSTTRYLVESDGGLLCVLRFKVLFHSTDIYNCSANDPEEAYYHQGLVTSRFEVYKLKEETRTWVEVKSIGDKVLFLGQSNSVSFWDYEVPGCKRNSIYFADDERFRGKKYGFFDLGVYNMEDGTIVPCYPSDVIHLQYSPLWFDLSFLSDVFIFKYLRVRPVCTIQK